jgi:hypothetical protein
MWGISILADFRPMGYKLSCCGSTILSMNLPNLDSRIDVGQEINRGLGNFGKNNKRRAMNKHRARNKMCKFILEKHQKTCKYP